MIFRKRIKKTNTLTSKDMQVLRVFRDQHRRAWRLGKEHLINHKLSSLFTAITMGIVFSLPGLFFCLLEKTEILHDKAGPSFTVTAFATHELPFEKTVQFSEEWAQDKRIQKIEVVGKDKAFEEFKDGIGLTGQDNHLGNPFPHVVFFTLRGDQIKTREAMSLQSEMESNPSIGSVISDVVWINQSRYAVRLITTCALVLGCLLVIGAILVVSQSTSSLVSRRGQEIRIQELIGATTDHIRRPFLYSGTILGLGAGLVALLMINFVLIIIDAPVSQLASSSNLKIPSIYPGSKTFVSVLALATLSGWAGSWIGSTLGIKKTKSEM